MDNNLQGNTIQQNVAQYLRELADKVERSSYCTCCVDDTPMYISFDIGGGVLGRYKTGERNVTLKLNYIEERL